MTLSEFVARANEFEPRVAKVHAITALQQVIARLRDTDPEDVVGIIEDGLFEGIVDLEGDDVFGTEGLKI